jgi:hypothetical protein
MINIPFHNTHPFPVLVVPEVFDEATGEWTANDDDCYIIEPNETGEILIDPCKRRAVVGGIDVS